MELQENLPHRHSAKAHLDFVVLWLIFAIPVLHNGLNELNVVEGTIQDYLTDREDVEASFPQLLNACRKGGACPPSSKGLFDNEHILQKTPISNYAIF